jgi:hypothetical protein
VVCGHDWRVLPLSNRSQIRGALFNPSEDLGSIFSEIANVTFELLGRTLRESAENSANGSFHLFATIEIALEDRDTEGLHRFDNMTTQHSQCLRGLACDQYAQAIGDEVSN